MNGAPILSAISRNWWVLALRGVVAILFGIGAFLWPGLTLAVLVVLWGAFVLVDGIVAIVAGARVGLWPLVLVGVIGALAGGYALSRPGVAALALLIVIAAWAIVRGIFEIVAAIRLRKEIANEWMMILGGIASVVFGLLVWLFPGAGALSLVWVIGLYAILAGVLFLGLAFRLRGMNGRAHAAAAA